MLFVYGLFRALPLVDPKKASYSRFQTGLDVILTILMLALTVIHGSIIAYGLGYKMNMEAIATYIIGVLFISIGNFMPRFRHNYFVGIKTPWSLANEQVWRKTHHFSARVFFISGIVLLLTPFLPSTAHIVTFFFVILASLLLSTGSSYYFFKNQK